ncbi:dinitrogenase iron-molybdenum cofactor biosynthesis protein [candidate division BRC1 bacterium SM23_51]|nr:MAG: dinitrogenase iron-molybdenum cofactor biosynthesis protein [candidate division BRC1 bacterium SM23_51]
MKIAITAQGKDIQNQVDPRFGRAPWFIIADTDTGQFEAVDNAQNVNALQGAGIQAAQNVARHGVACVLTGHCGPNAFRALLAAGIQVIVGIEGTVAEAIERFQRGELRPADRPNVEGRWA